MKLAAPTVLLCLVALLLSARAEARATVVVTRDAASQDCPDGRALELRVAVLMPGEEPPGGDPGPARLHVEIAREPSGFRARIHAAGSLRGTREIVDAGPTCANLADALAVSLAILLDERPKSAPAQVPARPEPQPSPPLEIEPQAGLGLAIGLLRAPMPLVYGGVLLWPRRWLALGLGAAHVWSDRIVSQRGALAVALDFGEARACLARPAEAPLGVRLCGGPLLGVLRGRGEGFARTYSQQLTWSAVKAGLVLVGPSQRPLSFWFEMSAIAPLVRQGFSEQRGEEVRELFEVPPVGLLALLGLRLVP